MALIKKHCLKLMLSEGGKYYFREPIDQNLAETPLAARALGTPPNKSNLATALHGRENLRVSNILPDNFFYDQKRVMTSSVT